MNKLRWFFVLGLSFVLVTSLIVGGCGPAEEEAELEIGFIYVGPVGDLGWTWAHDQGRQAIEAEFGDRVETNYAESVAEADALAVMEGMVDQGAGMVFATSFGYRDAIVELSERHDDIAFMHCAGSYMVQDNVGSCFGRLYEGQYLQGLVAGHETESDIIGYVAPHPVPAVYQDVNAFTLGVQEVNPDAEVRVVWTDTWHNPGIEREAAISLLDIGADVLAHHQDSPAVVQAAEERGALSFGYHSAQQEYAPDAVLTSTVWDWAEFYVPEVESVLDGTWEPRMYVGDLEDGMVKVTDLSDKASPEAQEAFNEARQQLEAGELDPFTGPIYDQDGELRVEEGETMPDDMRFSLGWWVQGVQAR